jgi:hypothetical protein
MVDDITDIRIAEDGDITLDPSNDLSTTKYEDTPLQSVYIHVKNAVQNYIGTTVNRDTLNSLGDDISDRVRRLDPQIDRVDSVNLTYQSNTDTVIASVRFVFNDEFQTVQLSEEI